MYLHHKEKLVYNEAYLETKKLWILGLLSLGVVYFFFSFFRHVEELTLHACMLPLSCIHISLLQLCCGSTFLTNCIMTHFLALAKPYTTVSLPLFVSFFLLFLSLGGLTVALLISGGWLFGWSNEGHWMGSVIGKYGLSMLVCMLYLWSMDIQNQL